MSSIRKLRSSKPNQPELKTAENGAMPQADVSAKSSEPAPYSINPDIEASGKRTLRLVVDKNGNIDSSMREKSLNELREALSKPATKTALFGEEKKDKSKREIVTPERCRTPWVFVGGITTSFLCTSLKVSKQVRPLVGTVCAYSPVELEQLSRLTAECLNFYADKLPPWFWELIEQSTGPLAQLIESVLAIHYVKYQTLKAALANPESFMESMKSPERSEQNPVN